MIQYPVNLEREGTRVLVSFPDFPNVHTFGDDEAEALARAVDAVETYLMAMMEDREPILHPRRAKRGQRVCEKGPLPTPSGQAGSCSMSESTGISHPARQAASNAEAPSVAWSRWRTIRTSNRVS